VSERKEVGGGGSTRGGGVRGRENAGREVWWLEKRMML